MDKKTRKKRTINNGLIDIDDISIEAGFKFINWTPIVRKKLKQREMVLLQKRLKICNDIIISSIHHFTQQNN